jgi:type IX secretion system PorP/SprF family membrane protein
MRTKSFFLIAISLVGVMAYGQQIPVSGFYDVHGVMHNPATAGTARYASIGASFRKQWDGMPGGPQTAMVYGNTALSNKKIGIGGYLYNDVTGPLRNTGLQLAYAYIIPLKDEASFSVGIEARLQQFSFDRQKLAATLGTTDPVIAGREARSKGDAGFGVAYTGRRLQVGASVSQLVQSKLKLYEGTSNTAGEAQFYRHFYLHARYDWKVDEYIHIYPNFLMVYLPNAPVQIQAGARLEYNELLWFGMSLRSQQSWMLSAGFKLKQKFDIGYSFDIYQTPLSGAYPGSNGHEFQLRYSFLK